MEDEAPTALKMAAVSQIVAGVINIGIGWWISSCTIGSVCGMASCGMGGQFCGIVALALVPLGLIEIGIGIYGLMNAREAAQLQRIVSFLEIAAILGGGITSLLVGVGVNILHMQDDSVAYLEG